MNYIRPTDEQFAAMAALEAPGPITLVNLVRFKEGGRRLYEVYARASRPRANKYGARARYLGEVAMTVVGNARSVYYPIRINSAEEAHANYTSRCRTGARRFTPGISWQLH